MRVASEVALSSIVVVVVVVVVAFVVCANTDVMVQKLFQ
jgi:hypothetical protein